MIGSSLVLLKRLLRKVAHDNGDQINPHSLKRMAWISTATVRKPRHRRNGSVMLAGNEFWQHGGVSHFGINADDEARLVGGAPVPTELATVVWPMSMPSLSNSPWMRGVPHDGLTALISRIRVRMFRGVFGRPAGDLDFQRQNARNPRRCQLITVAGSTTDKAFRMPGASR